MQFWHEQAEECEQDEKSAGVEAAGPSSDHGEDRQRHRPRVSIAREGER